jgi:hypothetical protein
METNGPLFMAFIVTPPRAFVKKKKCPTWLLVKELNLSKRGVLIKITISWSFSCNRSPHFFEKSEELNWMLLESKWSRF